MKFLIFGDVVGEMGRQAVTVALPQLRAEYEPDAVIVNIENSAHGMGISPSVLQEMSAWKADVYTTGDHAWDNAAGLPLLDNPDLPLVRPANYPPGVPGRGYYILQRGAWQIAIINLQGQVFMKNDPLSPFWYIDDLLKQPAIAGANIRLVDFHAEVGSEKRGFGWHVDGRVSAMWGTHTHIPTADSQILPQGTGYCSDVGMNGGHHSIIGFERAEPLKRFRLQIPTKLLPAASGPLEVNALFLDIDPLSSKTTAIHHLHRILEK
jgi:metallophosphoesterase (TIGR00282 family)